MTGAVATPLVRPAGKLGGSTGCPRGCAGHRCDRLLTSASVITVVRTIACVCLALAGLVAGEQALLVAALIVYWVGDVADGAVARRRDEETVSGAAPGHLRRSVVRRGRLPRLSR